MSFGNDFCVLWGMVVKMSNMSVETDLQNIVLFIKKKSKINTKQSLEKENTEDGHNPFQLLMILQIQILALGLSSSLGTSHHGDTGGHSSPE